MLKSLWCFLSLPAVAAFLGALSAYLLVIFTDRRRNHRKKKLVQRLIIISQRLARNKAEAIKMNQRVYKEQNRVIPATIIQFSSPEIRKLQTEVVDLLTDEEKIAIDTVCYFMEAIDKEIDENVTLIYKLIEIQPRFASDPSLEPEGVSLYQRIGKGYEEILANMDRLIEMIDMYEIGNYEDILTRKIHLGIEK